MSKADSQDGDSEPTPQTGVDTDNEPFVKIHLRGPVTFSRSISEQHSVTAIHDQATVDGALVIGQEALFEIAPPESSLDKNLLLRKILDHDTIRDGYTHGDPDEWDLEFEATVEDWRALTADVKAELPYRNGDPKPQIALEYLASLANAGVLGDSGLMTILELGQHDDVTLADRKRADLLDALQPEQ